MERAMDRFEVSRGSAQEIAGAARRNQHRDERGMMSPTNHSSLPARLISKRVTPLSGGMRADLIISNRTHEEGEKGESARHGIPRFAVSRLVGVKLRARARARCIVNHVVSLVSSRVMHHRSFTGAYG